MSNDYCALHGYEPIPPNVFRVCGECHHAYATAEDLLAADREITDELRQHNPGYDTAEWSYATHPDQVHCCPLCCHDF